MKALFADAQNGITDMFAGTFHASSAICVGDQCLSKDDISALRQMEQGGASGASQAAASATVSSSQSDTAVTYSNAASSTDSISTQTLSSSTPPQLEVEGNNPATISVGNVYNDLGAIITGPQQDLNLGIDLSVDGQKASAVQIDTSAPGDHTIVYTVVDGRGEIGQASRLVHVVDPNATATSTDTAATDSSDTTSTSTDSADSASSPQASSPQASSPQADQTAP